MKINDLVRCDDVRGSESLTDGAIYKIVEINQYGNVSVARQFNFDAKIFSAPLQHFYKPSRFTLTEVVSTQKIDLSQEYKTRSGLKVVLFAFSDDENYPLVGQYYDKKWWNEQWKSNGTYIEGTTGELDLIEVTEPQDHFKSFNCEAEFYIDGSIKLQGKKEYAVATVSKQDFANLIEAYEAYNSQN